MAEAIAEIHQETDAAEIWAQDFHVEPLAAGLALLTYRSATSARTQISSATPAGHAHSAVRESRHPSGSVVGRPSPPAFEDPGRATGRSATGILGNELQGSPQAAELISRA